jgi:hypothetical protein
LPRIFDLIRQQLHQRLDIDPLPPKEDPLEWAGSEWSHEFERLCRNRMFVGGTRYGKLGAENKPQWDRCSDIKHRISLYERTGNLEYLVDAANLCQCEYVEGDHPLRHFSSEDDGDVHTKRK